MSEAQMGAGEFEISLLGFKKADVLTYIDALTAESLKKEQEHEARERELQEIIDALEEDKNTLITKTREVCQQLSAQERHGIDLDLQLEEAKEQLEHAQKNVDSYKGRLFLQEKELISLRAENTRVAAELEEQKANAVQAAQEVADLMRQRQLLEQELEETTQKAAVQLEEMRSQAAIQTEQQVQLQRQMEENSQEAARQLETVRTQAAERAAEVKQQMIVDAHSLAEGVAVLKEQMAAVDAKVTQAALQLQQATQSLNAVLGDTRQDLQTLEAKVDRIPAQTVAQEPAQGPRVSKEPEKPAAEKAAQPRPRGGRRTLADALLERMARMMVEN